MSKRIVVLPEELEVFKDELKRIMKQMKSEQQQIGDPILGTEGVMNLLKVSRRCLQTWRDKGMIEFSAVSGKYFYRMSAINKMLDRYVQKAEE